MPSETTKARAIEIAHEMLLGRIGAIEAARLLCPLLHRDPIIVSREDFNSIVGIESETDDLPVGKVREHWHPDVFPEKDREIARCEGLYMEQVRAICERILAGTQPN